MKDWAMLHPIDEVTTLFSAGAINQRESQSEYVYLKRVLTIGYKNTLPTSRYDALVLASDSVKS